MTWRTCFWTVVALGALLANYQSSMAAEPPAVTAIRVPEGGLQPQVAVDAAGVLHLIYLRGKADGSDIFYTRSSDGGLKFSKPRRVNSQDGSAMAIGTVRGPHLALGKNDRVHVAWMGSNPAEPKAPGNNQPMLYTRLNDAGDAFEPQRNLIQAFPGLDGGGSIAADGQGGVFVAWHAPTEIGAGEKSRRVYVAQSTDDGLTFSRERPVSGDGLGACGCCGLRLGVSPQGKVFGLYRSVEMGSNRDMFLIEFDGATDGYQSLKIDPMVSSLCVMSTAAMTPGAKGVLAAWETNKQIYWAEFANPARSIKELSKAPHIAAPGATDNRKHPAIAVNRNGQKLVAWSEGTGWNKGGIIAWQVYDKTNRPMSKASGRAADLPTWSIPAVFARPDGSFVVLY